MSKSLIYFEKNRSNDYLAFHDDGTLGCSTYSYEIDSCGEMELDQDETRQLYEAMRSYYSSEAKQTAEEIYNMLADWLGNHNVPTNILGEIRKRYGI